MRRFFAICALVGSFLFGSPSVHAQTPSDTTSQEVRAVVQRILRDETENGRRQMQFEAIGEDGQTYVVDTASSYTEGLRYDIHEGDRVILTILFNEFSSTAVLSDVVRTHALAWIFAAFALLTVAVGLMRGLMSLLGLGITLGILFLGVFPSILSGSDPVLVTVIGCIIILAVNMHLSHGFNRRTFVAFLSAVIPLGLAVVFSKVFVAMSQLSGLANEEATFLYWQATTTHSPVGILLAGMILGATGVLDDIAVTQGETVAELREANPALTSRELYTRAMRVGRHHIASTVNTLVLAYAGAALPLLLLFLSSSVSIPDFVNTELVAEEIIRTLAGTSALVLAVPIATFLAAWAEPFTRKAPHQHG